MVKRKNGNIFTIGVVGFVVVIGSTLLLNYIDKTIKLYDYKIETTQSRYEVEQSEHIIIGLFDSYFSNNTIQLKYEKDEDIENQYNLISDNDLYLFKDSQLNHSLELTSFEDTLDYYTNNKYINVDISVKLHDIGQSRLSKLANGIDTINKATIKSTKFDLMDIPIKVSVKGVNDTLNIEFKVKGIQVRPKSLGYEGKEYCNIEYRFNTSKMKIETIDYRIGGNYEN